MQATDVVVVGAGVVGLAIARALALRGREVIVLERHADFGTETSARNSEVIHAGIYYPAGSLKARLCVEGSASLYSYCEEHGIPHRRCGKLIVANGEAQERKLESLARQAAANGAKLEVLDVAAARRLEPAVRCSAALLSPATGIIDSSGYMRSLLGELEDAGGMLARETAFERASIADGAVDLEAASGGERMSLRCRWLINSAGLSAPAVAARIEGLPAEHRPQSWYAKGHYFTYSGRSPFTHLVYPMPNEAGLGTHATLDLAGRVRFGPDVEWIDTPSYDVDAARAQSFFDAIVDYWPDVELARLEPAYAGVRPKITGPGSAAADFRIEGPDVHGVEGLVNLFGIESPGLTSSLAIARDVEALVASR